MFKPEKFIPDAIKKIKEEIGDEKAIIALPKLSKVRAFAFA